jgi:ATP-dependent helicase/nuclease subunit B
VNVRLVAPRDDLIAVVASALTPAGRDYSRSWVVFPEKRPAFYLRKALAARAGTALIPPRIDSIDGFVDAVYEERLGLRDRPLGLLDAVALLFDIHRSVPGRPGGSHFLSPDAFFPLGSKLFNDLEEMRMAEVRSKDLVASDLWTEKTIPPETRSRLQSLSSFYETFYAKLRASGFSTPASRFREVADRLERGLFPDLDRLILAGFFSLTKTEAKILRTLLDWDEVSLVLLKGAGLETILDGLKIRDPELRRGLNGPDPGPAIAFTRSPDSHGQIFALNRVLADSLADPRRLNERQVIVLPAAETLFPLHQQTLARLSEEDYNISLGYPLSRTPLFGFFNTLMELIQSLDEEGRVYGPNYLRFILHPYTKNLYGPGPDGRSDLTRILFHAVEEELVGRRTQAFWSLEELETDPGLRAALETRVRRLEGAPDVVELLGHYKAVHDRTIRPLLEIRDLADFVAKLDGVLAFITASGTARRHPFFHPYAEALEGQLDAMAGSLLGGVAFQDRASYFNLFRKVVAAATVPFVGTPLRGLQVLGFWETRCIRFDEIYVLDMNEEVIPPYRRGDSLLPFGARRALGLPTYLDNERRMEYYLDTLVTGGRTVHFFFVEDNEKERSRFVEKLLWDRERSGAGRVEPIRTVRYDVALQAERPAAARKTPAMAEFLAGFRFSATALDAYLACPLRFYYAYVLKLEEREAVTERMERKDVGGLVHAVLEEYFSRFAGRTVRAAELKPADLDALVERRFRDLYGAHPAGSAYLMGLQVRRHLGEFLTDYQIPLVAGLERQGEALRILGLEQRFEAEREVRGRGFRLAARVDRTELRGDVLTILDYKTSARTDGLKIRFDRLDPADRATWSNAVASLQLPFYGLVYGLSRGLPPEGIRGLFLMLGKGRLGPKIEFSPFDETDPAVRQGQLDLAEAVIDGLLSEIVDPGRDFDPGLARKDACDRCAYATLCGRS